MKFKTSLLIVGMLLTASCNQDLPEGKGSQFTTRHFAGAGKCAACHDGLEDASGQDVSIASDWSSTMMANSTRDPFWRAKVASEIRRTPALTELINDECTRCHAPMANFEARAAGSTVALFGDGFLSEQNGLHEAALDGVSCTLCHQIRDNETLGTLEGFSGKYTIGTYNNPTQRAIFGPYSSPRTGPMQNNVSYTPTHGPHIERSELCATCHNLKTPFVNAQGVVASTSPESEFPEQMIYSEWKNSSFAGANGKSCSSCHLPQTDGVRIATRPMNLPSRDAFGRHLLVGGNTTMLDLLDSNRQELGVTAEHFPTTIARTREMLASAAQLSLHSQNNSGAIEVAVRIENHSGHKLPGGYPSRRVWLHFVARDQAGAVLFESGKPQEDGSIAGVDADSVAAAYEPHHDLITSPDQVQVYEGIMGDTDGQVTYTLLRGASYLKDNRLLPAGFPKETAPNDVAVVGNAAQDASFLAGGDEVTYRFSATPPLSIEVTLRYQAIAHGFVRDLFLDEESPEVARFKAMYESARIRSEAIATASAAIP